MCWQNNRFNFPMPTEMPQVRICWFHKHFGCRARKCNPGCNWSANYSKTARTKPKSTLHMSSPRYHTKSSLFFVEDVANSFKFLVDPRASVSLLPNLEDKRSMFNQCSGKVRLSETNCPSTGNKVLDVSLQGVGCFKWKFQIANVRHPVIGLDFIKRFNLIVDGRSGRLRRLTKTINITPPAPKRKETEENQRKALKTPKDIPAIKKPSFTSSAIEEDNNIFDILLESETTFIHNTRRKPVRSPEPTYMHVRRVHDGFVVYETEL